MTKSPPHNYADEQQLIDALIAGDDRAFCEIISRFQHTMTAVAHAICGDTFADDVVQDAWVAIHKNIVVKVPMIKDGIKALKWFTDNGIRTNCTLIFSAGQAILAAKAGATYVSPFLGRVDDSGWDGMDLIHQMRQIFSMQGYKTEILAASIRNPLHIIKCAEAGADVCTCPLDSILGLLKHPLTDIGLAKFLEDAKKFA